MCKNIKNIINLIAYNIKKNIKSSIAIVSFPVIMLLLLGPVEIYYSNMTDFDFTIKEFFLLFLIISFFISFFSKKSYHFFTTIILTLSLSSYFQNAFLNKKLSEKDGTAVKWNELDKLITINTIIWILLVSILLIILWKCSTKIQTYISLFFVTIQIVALISLIINICKIDIKMPHYQLDGEGQFEVASEENIIVIVLDATGEKYVHDIYESDNSLVSPLKDFTWFTNYDSLYMPTFPSMIHMLTGYDPDTSVPRIQYQADAWNSEKCNKFYKELHKSGYICNLYSSSQKYVYGNTDEMIGKIDNLKYKEPKVNKKLMLSMLEKYTLYRYSPYIVKPRLEVNMDHYRGVVVYDGEETTTVNSNTEFNEKVVQGLKINNHNKKAFIIQHIQGMHGPINTAKDGTYDENATPTETVYGLMVILDTYFNQLKSEGIYDNSTIIVTADHGWYDDPDGDLQAIFFIKLPKEEHNSIQFNDAPICSDDFQATILKCANLEYNGFGKSIFDWESGEKRERTTYDSTDMNGYTYYYNGNELRTKIKDGYDVIGSNNTW